jgi:hypothetical protein
MDADVGMLILSISLADSPKSIWVKLNTDCEIDILDLLHNMIVIKSADIWWRCLAADIMFVLDGIQPECTIPP